MSDDRIEELLMEIVQKVSKIETQLSNSSNTLQNHEHRIETLEKHPSNQVDFNPKSEDNFKTEMLKLLGKCVLIGLTVIATLTGASGLISKVIGQ